MSSKTRPIVEGERFGHLVVVAATDNSDGRRVKVRCDCGWEGTRTFRRLLRSTANKRTPMCVMCRDALLASGPGLTDRRGSRFNRDDMELLREIRGW